MPAPDSADRIRALIALYRATHYEVMLPDGSVVTLRIGAAVPSTLRDWIGTDRLAGFLSACNPHSRALSSLENAQRLAELRERLRGQRYRFLEGIGHIPSQPWHEPSVLVTGVDLALIDTLAADFAQNATIVATPAGVVRLRLHRAEWRTAIDDDANLEWDSS